MKFGPAVFGGGLLGVLLLATSGNAGSQPDVLFAWHTALFAFLLASWWFAGPGGTGRRPASGVALALAALALVMLVGFARAPYAYAAWLGVVEAAAFAAAFVLAVRNGDWLLAWLGPALVAGGWIQTGMLVYQRLVLGDPRPAGTFLNPNYLAGWLGATLLFCAGRWIAAPQSGRARWTAVASIPLLAGLVLTGSRGGWAGVGVGSLLLAGLAWKAMTPARRRILIAVLLVAGIAGSAAIALRLRHADPFRYQRVKIWQASVMPLLAHPWTGTGPGQFAREAPNLQFPDGRGALRYDRGFRTTHSDWIRAGAELGWPGVLALAWIAVSVIAHAARRRRDSDPVDSGALAALTGLFVHAAVDNVSRAPALYLLGAAFLGIVTAVDAPARRAVRPLWRVLAAGVALHLFVVGDFGPWRDWSRLQSGSAATERAWNPADAEQWMRLAESRVSNGPRDREAYAEARSAAERAVRLSPRDGELRRRLARIEVASIGVWPLDRAGRERIAGLYRRAAELQRNNPSVPIELAAFLLDAEDPVGGRRAAERALEIEPEAAVPRLLLARALLELGEPQRAAAMLDEASGRAREHAVEAASGGYAGDLLIVDPALVRQIRGRIDAARQPGSHEPRFGPEDQEDEAGG